MADFYPHQGGWSEESYLNLETNRLVELTDGHLEFLPMPDEIHWFVQNYLFQLIEALLRRRGGGVARYAPFRMMVGPERYREPDICLLLDKKDARRGRRYWSGADLVMEVVSPDHPDRDYVDKRHDYACAGVQEYWIIDPQLGAITVFVLDGSSYLEHGVFEAGQVARGLLMSELEVDASACFAAADQACDRDDPLPPHDADGF